MNLLHKLQMGTENIMSRQSMSIDQQKQQQEIELKNVELNEQIRMFILLSLCAL